MVSLLDFTPTASQIQAVIASIKQAIATNTYLTVYQVNSLEACVRNMELLLKQNNS